ncbi:hypothetical protein ACM01_14735 [Streptomyces viridochromogenes]|uniref:Uncharacterized protein n=1 Tax=Streptomyces viridochromogenes TaxID=1938 RepID=A0A0J7ZEA1_STRVR|nr:hypothetical protein [Streptomyces viridochromogenes]KMS74179.1 hypothetical protein ACM01_14735 [Streptomyces viridochromogenes]
MLTSTWVRLTGGQLVRADRIVAVRSERAEVVPAGRWGVDRIMVCLDVAEADAEADNGSWWQEAAVCQQDRSDHLVVNLVNLIAKAAAGSGLRFIYPVLRDGQFDRWTSGSVLPPVEGPAITGLPRTPRDAPARA